MTWEDEPTGRIGDPVIVARKVLPQIAFLQSPHCQRLARPYTQFVEIHCTDGHEGPGDAEACVKMFADPALQPKRSAHYAVDSGKIWQAVRDGQIAWHSGHTANARGIGVEICGRANQTREQWLDEASMPTLELAARLVAYLCSAYGIPRQLLLAADLVAGKKGLTTHAEVSRAWHETNHQDPGPNFPLLAFVRAVQLAG